MEIFRNYLVKTRISQLLSEFDFGSVSVSSKQASQIGKRVNKSITLAECFFKNIYFDEILKNGDKMFMEKSSKSLFENHYLT